MGIEWENTALYPISTKLPHILCAGIGPLQLGVVLVVYIIVYIIVYIYCIYYCIYIIVCIEILITNRRPKTSIRECVLRKCACALYMTARSGFKDKSKRDIQHLTLLCGCYLMDYIDFIANTFWLWGIGILHNNNKWDAHANKFTRTITELLKHICPYFVPQNWLLFNYFF